MKAIYIITLCILSSLVLMDSNASEKNTAIEMCPAPTGFKTPVPVEIEIGGNIEVICKYAMDSQIAFKAGEYFFQALCPIVKPTPLYGGVLINTTKNKGMLVGKTELWGSRTTLGANVPPIGVQKVSVYISEQLPVDAYVQVSIMCN